MRRGSVFGLVATLALAAVSLSALAAVSLSAAAPLEPLLASAPIGSAPKPNVAAELATGVVRVQARTCGGRTVRSGTGFLVGRQVVMTARHVLTGACSYSVIGGARSYEADRPLFWYTAGSRDEEVADVATMRLLSPVRGHLFTFSRRNPAPTATIAVIGFSLRGPLTLQRVPLVATPLDHGVPQLEIGIATARGSSGSALVDAHGHVVGVLQRSVVPLTGARAWGIDLVRWWGSDVMRDLCRAYPRGGLVGCSRAPG